MTSDRLGRDQWIEAALDALGQGGLAAVSVEPLARALGVTKGSFYWHFADRAALLHAAVARWAGRTEETIAALDVADPRERLATLLRMAYATPSDRRVARVLASMLEDPVAGPAVRHVTERRIGFITTCCRQAGLTRPAEASRVARLLYAAYLGLAELDALGLGLRTPEERDAYLAQMTAALLPEARPSSRPRTARRRS